MSIFYRKNSILLKKDRIGRNGIEASHNFLYRYVRIFKILLR